MSFETVTKIAERLFESPFVGDCLTVVWHAGEPLVMPVDYYREAWDIFGSANSRRADLAFAFQTNATLIDAEWCSFFSTIRARVGVSIDGPQRIHDAHRKTRSGRGSFDRTLRGLRLLQENGLAPSVIMVVTKAAIECPDEVWEFFKDLNVDTVGFNTDEAEGPHVQSSLRGANSRAAYRAFFERILERCLSEGRHPRVREWELFMKMLGADQDLHPQENTPAAILSFDHRGNISTFSPELLTVEDSVYGDFAFGNVHDESLEEALGSAKFARVYADVRRGVEACRATCEFFSVCGGGSPANKFFENGTFSSTETQACICGSWQLPRRSLTV